MRFWWTIRTWSRKTSKHVSPTLPNEWRLSGYTAFPVWGLELLVDVSAGVAVADALRALGLDTVFVRDRVPMLSDEDILMWAVADGRLVVTMDKDFGELVYRSGLPHAGVLLLRLEDARTDEKIRIVTDIVSRFDWALPSRFAVYRTGRLRIR